MRLRGAKAAVPPPSPFSFSKQGTSFGKAPGAEQLSFEMCHVVQQEVTQTLMLSFT